MGPDLPRKGPSRPWKGPDQPEKARFSSADFADFLRKSFVSPHFDFPKFGNRVCRQLWRLRRHFLKGTPEASNPLCQSMEFTLAFVPVPPQWLSRDFLVAQAMLSIIACRRGQGY